MSLGFGGRRPFLFPLFCRSKSTVSSIPRAMPLFFSNNIWRNTTTSSLPSFCSSFRRSLSTSIFQYGDEFLKSLQGESIRGGELVKESIRNIDNLLIQAKDYEMEGKSTEAQQTYERALNSTNDVLIPDNLRFFLLASTSSAYAEFLAESRRDQPPKDWQLAITLSKHALKAFQTIPDSIYKSSSSSSSSSSSTLQALRELESTCYRAIGKAEGAGGALATSEQTFTKSLTLAEEIPSESSSKFHITLTLISLARLYELQGNMPFAEGLYNKSIELLQEILRNPETSEEMKKKTTRELTRAKSLQSAFYTYMGLSPTSDST